MFKKFRTIFFNETHRMFTKGILIIGLLLLIATGILTYFAGTGDLAKALPVSDNFPVIPISILAASSVTIWFLFLSFCQSTTDMINGDKERGILSLMLVSVVPRKVLAGSKLAALGFLTVICTLCFSGGFLLPAIWYGLDVYNYTVTECIQLVLILLSTALTTVFLSALIATCFTPAKEAAFCTGFIGFGIALIPMFCLLDGPVAGLGWRFIPFMNTVLTFCDLLQHQASTIDIIITCVSNVLFAAVFVFIWVKMIASEKFTLRKTIEAQMPPV